MMDRRPPNKNAGASKNRSNQQVRSLGLVLRNTNHNNDRKVVKKTTNRNPIPTDKNNELVEGTHETPVGTVTVRKIEPAKEYNVLAVARAMNPDLATGVKELFDPELQAAQLAIETGLYISWRPKMPPYDRQDCQRVAPSSRCFCDHLLEEHEKFTGIERFLKCQELGCPCKAFNFIPSRPEELGEYWLRRRKNFDPLVYRCVCRCKHTHVQHDPIKMRCRISACGCSYFNSSSVCAACDRHTEEHETRLETEAERLEDKRPVGEEWLPFAEITTLKKMVLTGEDDGGSMDRDLQAPVEQPSIAAGATSNATPFPAPKGKGTKITKMQRRSTSSSDHTGSSSASNAS